ncbi:uncharacterized protein BXZ73DRAFT_109672 [Epithele typhae]|uniref:uncharacterized protein n=1 Tax=Epithele typhae TaxID=378194 RepID=UPI0020072BAF|nr:uncharacterized protein BXZ73DRAFT_109672 [Epithele typhae]KAH9909428.1 hypothetical protein BXZ73DRAFT_109672 [Epithele typhae]
MSEPGSVSNTDGTNAGDSAQPPVRQAPGPSPSVLGKRELRGRSTMTGVKSVKTSETSTPPPLQLVEPKLKSQYTVEIRQPRLPEAGASGGAKKSGNTTVAPDTKQVPPWVRLLIRIPATAKRSTTEQSKSQSTAASASDSSQISQSSGNVAEQSVIPHSPHRGSPLSDRQQEPVVTGVQGSQEDPDALMDQDRPVPQSRSDILSAASSASSASQCAYTAGQEAALLQLAELVKQQALAVVAAEQEAAKQRVLAAAVPQLSGVSVSPGASDLPGEAPQPSGVNASMHAPRAFHLPQDAPHAKAGEAGAALHLDGNGQDIQMGDDDHIQTDDDHIQTDDDHIQTDDDHIQTDDKAPIPVDSEDRTSTPTDAYSSTNEDEDRRITLDDPERTPTASQNSSFHTTRLQAENRTPTPTDDVYFSADDNEPGIPIDDTYRTRTTLPRSARREAH